MGYRGATGNLLVHFGKQLRRLRAEAGLTQEQLGRRVGYSAALIGMIETARRMPSFDLTVALDRVLNARGVLEGLWVPMREMGTPDAQIRELAEQEARALAIDTYEGCIVPGMLQTEEYTRALVGSIRPQLDRDASESRVALRLSRQRSLDRPDPPRLWAIIGEAALYQQRGDRAVMRDQMRHILAAADSHTTTLQVLPFSAQDPTWGMSFSVVALDDEMTLLVYANVFPMGIYRSTRNDDVFRCREVFDYLRGAALPESESLDLVERRVKELC